MEVLEAPSYELSGWWRRYFALWLDNVILAIPSYIIISLGHGINTESLTNTYNGATLQLHFLQINGQGYLLQAGVLTVYALLTMCRDNHNGRTLGMQALGIGVIRNDMSPMAPGRVMVRQLLCQYLPLLVFVETGWALAAVFYFVWWAVDYFAPLFDGEKRAIHDRIAGTHVVRLRKQPKVWSGEYVLPEGMPKLHEVPASFPPMKPDVPALPDPLPEEVLAAIGMPLPDMPETPEVRPVEPEAKPEGPLSEYL